MKLINFVRCDLYTKKFQKFDFGAPNLSRISFSGGPDIKGTYKICNENKRKFKLSENVAVRLNAH